MNHLIHSRQRIDTSTPRELEAIVRRLWMTEPRCSVEHRSRLLIELGSVGLALERIILHDEARFDPTATDDRRRASDLADCDRRIRNLLVHWPGDDAASSPLDTAA